MKTYILIITIIIGIPFFIKKIEKKVLLNCEALSSAIETKEITEDNISLFENTIKKINKEEEWISNDVLFLSSEFIEIYENPESYKLLAIELIKDESTTIKEKKIIILSMQRLGLNSYLQLVNFISMSDTELLQIAILGSYGNNIFSDNFYCINVRHFLTEILNSELPNQQNKSFSKKILSGRFYLENKILNFLNENNN